SECRDSTSLGLTQHPRVATPHLSDYLNVPVSRFHIFRINSTSQGCDSTSFGLSQPPSVAIPHLWDYLNILVSRLHNFRINSTSFGLTQHPRVATPHLKVFRCTSCTSAG